MGDFNEFYSEFVRLANLSKKPREEWKEEIHDKLYEELQVPPRDLCDKRNLRL